MKKKIFAAMLLLSGLSSSIFAHGMEIQARKHPPVVLITSTYKNSSTISYAAVTVFYEEQTVEFQNGRSDRNGNFAFMPDKPGKWSFHLDDEMGHAEKIEIMIGEDFFQDALPMEKKESKQDFYYCKILAGLFLILVLTFLFYLGLKKREKAT